MYNCIIVLYTYNTYIMMSVTEYVIFGCLWCSIQCKLLTILFTFNIIYNKESRDSLKIKNIDRLLDDTEALQVDQMNEYRVKFTGYIDLSIPEVPTTNSCNLLSFCFSMSKTSKTTSPSQTLEKCLLCTSNVSLLILESWGKKPSCDLACNIIASQPQTKKSTVLLYVECKGDHRQVSTLDGSTVILSDVGNSTLCCMCVLCTCPTFTYNSLQLTNYKEAKLTMETNKQGGTNKPHECEVYHK